MLIRIFYYLILMLCFSSFLSAQEVFVPNGKTDAILKEAKKGNYFYAQTLAAGYQDKLISEIIDWMKLQDVKSEKNFTEFAAFYKDHQDWPETEILKNNIEEYTDSLGFNDRITWFKNNPPKTGWGRVFYIEALEQNNNGKNADSTISNIVKDTWVNYDLSQELEQIIYSKFSDYLDDNDHLKRLERLLFLEKLDAVERNLDYLAHSQKQEYLYKKNLVHLINQDYNNLEFNDKLNLIWHDPLISFLVAKVYQKIGEPVDAANYMLKIPEHVNFQDRVFKLKKLIVRDLLKEKQYQLALKVNNVHLPKDSSERAETIWLSGFIASELLDRPSEGLSKFEEFSKLVHYPVSIARGEYWQAIAHAKLAHFDQAQQHLIAASTNPETFYGQLSLIKLNKLGDLDLPMTRLKKVNSRDSLKSDQFIRAAAYLAHAGLGTHAKKFVIASMQKTSDPEQIANITRIGLDIGLPSLSVQAAKHALRQKVLVPESAYPILNSKVNLMYGEHALVLSLTRQESEFDRFATSKSGALGLMQLLPSTAKEVSERNNIVSSLSKLYETDHNIILGSLYIDQLLGSLQGSYVLAIASYNAGMGNVRKWIDLYGDPREMTNIDDVVKWIELIPFSETRNYVARVLENLQVYRFLLAKENKQSYHLVLDEDLLRKNEQTAKK